jgi:23S rRNA (guanine745-N1)-methyltransferase
VLADVVDRLSCPLCGRGLTLAAGMLRCEAGHSFDVARQGYVYLLAGGARPGGDTSEMVEARESFLRAGHFARIAEVAADAVGELRAGCVADIGAGTGYYLARVLECSSAATGVALELSRHALRRAVRAHPRAGAVGCDVWRSLPLRSGAVSAALSVFAPRNGEEIARVLAPGARLVVVTPSVRHLGELAAPLGLLSVDERKRERLDARLSPHLHLERESPLEWTMWLTREEAGWLAGMGPSAYHTSADELAERIAELPEPMAVTASVIVSAYAR